MPGRSLTAGGCPGSWTVVSLSRLKVQGSVKKRPGPTHAAGRHSACQASLATGQPLVQRPHMPAAQRLAASPHQSGRLTQQAAQLPASCKQLLHSPSCTHSAQGCELCWVLHSVPSGLVGYLGSGQLR